MTPARLKISFEAGWGCVEAASRRENACVTYCRQPFLHRLHHIVGAGVGLSQTAALQLGASLAPTDPVLLASDVQVGSP
jgi:hypothetical protein